MLTGKIRNDIDKLWEKFWTGGVTDPLTVIKQISYLIFSRMLDMQEENAERKANRTGQSLVRLFPNTPEGQLLRWKNYRHLSGAELHKHLKEKVFPHFAELIDPSNDGLGLAGEYMREATLEIKNESVLVSAIELINELPLTQSDVKGDIYEYLLSKLSTAGINGQFRTPRHIIDFMINLVEPKPTETVCDPACGTAGFLVRTMEYLNRTHSSEAGIIKDEDGNLHYTGDLLAPYQSHINHKMFWGFDFDSTMLQVSSMNTLLHGIKGANICYQDTLNKSIKEHFPYQEKDFFDVILANPPFKGSLDETNTNPDVLNLVKTKKTELLFVAHILRALKIGGRAGVIVPDGVLFGSSKAHQQLRKYLIEQNQLEAVISLPSGVFKPYAGVSTAILLFSKGGNTEKVWFYDIQADGYSLDDKRSPIEQNDLPTAEKAWQRYVELQKADNQPAIEAEFGGKTQACFCVNVQDIAANGYDLSLNRYKEVVYQAQTFEDPKVILGRIEALENEIQAGLKALREMV